MKLFTNRYSDSLVAAAVFAVVFVFWLCGYPQALNFQEENQLFLFSGDYLFERLSVAGGLADWMGEFIVQFYYLPWLGAALLAAIFVVLQRLTVTVLRCGSAPVSVTRVLSLLPVVFLLGIMGDENILLSYVFAIVLSLAAYVGLSRMPVWADIVIVPVLYWLTGPMTALYVFFRIIENPRKEWWTALWLIAVELASYTFILKEYPLREVLLGINYYRIPLVLSMPWTLFVVPLTIVLGKCLSMTAAVWYRGAARRTRLASVLCLCLLAAVSAVLGIYYWYPKDKYELMMQDYLLRHCRWQEVIERAEHYQVRTTFSSNAVNLALAMTGQLAERQFEFYQSGTDALIMRPVRDNFSNLPSAEAFYHLGMINSAKRYMYDIQESILNGRQSGRCMKRIAECFIINGQYKVAKKYLDVLGQSLFYRRWAEDDTRRLYSDAKVDDNAEWARLRRVRYRKNYLFDNRQMDKLFGLLVVCNKENTMAIDYFMAQLLLNADAGDFMNYLGWVMQQRGYTQLPAGYSDAVNCIKSHGTSPASVYAGYVRTSMTDKAKGAEEP